MRKKFTILFVLLLSLLLITGCGGSTPEEQADELVQNVGEEQTDESSENVSEESVNESSENTGEEQVNDSISIGLTSFDTADLYGEEVNESIFQDYSLTLVNVWGTFCGPCLEEMPYLGEIHEEYEPQGVNVVGIVIDIQDEDLKVDEDQRELAKEIVQDTGAEYTHLVISEDMIDSVLSQFDAIPASFFVDSDGNIVSEFYIGSKSKEEWVDVIEENINKN